VPSLDGGDDFLGVFGPDEGLWVLMMPGQEAVYGGLESRNGASARLSYAGLCIQRTSIPAKISQISVVIR
jgi:hypothetical protein